MISNMEEIVDQDKLDGIELMEHYEKALMDGGDFHDVPAENVTHDGITLRKCFMPAGHFVSGHEHKRSHWNIVLSGKAIVSQNGEHSKIEAGDVFVSKPHVRKGLFIVEDMEFMTIHHNPTNETDNDKLEDMFVRKSDNYHNLGLKKREELACLSE